jgi:hypothetical protein
VAPRDLAKEGQFVDVAGNYRGGGLRSPRRLRSASVDDMRAYLIAVAVLAVVTTLVFWMVAHPWGCSGVDAETISEEQRVALIGQGWRGDPDDNRDAIYPPQCAP